MEINKGDNCEIKNNKGDLLSKKQNEEYLENRFKCLYCKVEQCKNCKETPYHLGMTCEELNSKKQKVCCRYCDNIIQQDQNSNQICNNEKECIEKYKYSCKQKLLCNHQCFSYEGHKNECLCLNKNCENVNNQQKGEDFCNLCFVELLKNSPVIKTKCGHFFHYKCLEKRIKIGQSGIRINFNFCLCAVCHQWIEVEGELEILLQQHLNQLKQIKEMSIKRLKHEGRDKDERFNNIHDKYYNNQLQYALQIYSYYRCYKCNKPYFGGLKQCEQLIEENQNFQAKDLVCPRCVPDNPCKECQIHGTDFIEYKCKYCCNIAQWFCHGTTHYCNKCHSGLISQKKPEKCKGKDCPLKVQHPPNGLQEFALGCALCREFKNTQKNLQF